MVEFRNQYVDHRNRPPGRMTGPSLHPAAIDWTYMVRRPARSRVVVTRTSRDGAEERLLDATRRGRVDWAEVAQRILEDALDEPPVRKLALDYAHFIFLRSGEQRTISGIELDGWLESWSLPSLAGDLPRRGGR
jgi:hypothetical protein